MSRAKALAAATSVAAFLLQLCGGDASAAPAPPAREVVATKTLTTLDDTRGCQPLAAGGFAVATGGGLVIVAKDGTRHVLTSLQGLPDTRVHAVAEQGDGVWVGTEGGAAFVKLSGSAAPKTAPRIVRTALTTPIQAIHVAADGAVFLGSRGGGVFRVAAGDARPEPVPSRAKGSRVAAMSERDGALYVAFADGPLTKLIGGSLAVVGGSPTHGQALAAVGPDLWLGDLEGLYKVGASGVTPVASVDARGLAATGSAADGAVLVATWGSGLMTATARGALRAVDGVPATARWVATRDRVRCVATTDGLYVDEGSGRFRAVALGGPASNDVTALAVDAGGTRVAIGTFDGGATVFRGGSQSRIRGLARDEAVSAMTWQGDRLWIATANGLVRVDADGAVRRFTSHDGLPHTYVRAVHVLSAGRIIAGTDAGPAFVDGDVVTPLAAVKKGAPASTASPMHAVWALGSRPDGTLYIGTNAGLYYGKDGRFDRASLASGALPDDWVTALAVDGNDVWVGTYAKGVTRLAMKGTSPVATHLGGGYVNADGIVVSGGAVYVATMDHLLVRPKDDDARRWAPQPRAAPGRDVTQVRRVGSETWVASRRGIGIMP